MHISCFKRSDIEKLMHTTGGNLPGTTAAGLVLESLQPMTRNKVARLSTNNNQRLACACTFGVVEASSIGAAKVELSLASNPSFMASLDLKAISLGRTITSHWTDFVVCPNFRAQSLLVVFEGCNMDDLSDFVSSRSPVQPQLKQQGPWLVKGSLDKLSVPPCKRSLLSCQRRRWWYFIRALHESFQQGT